ncbi:MAG TPA: transcription termination/antitermination protein NusG [Fervidobacterium sp.]|nr:transcription termination/antitermination factor NusG [Thermotogaceae bacterium]HOK33983.1 transcription termination/antitermination protein NusG [Fervidobacterium sp.]HOL04018.1 transcription termination/antitermination protein NusG [Fervidobacterium sp.]HON04494.1 transcription termination/antitermination protein NusG [Fervidobacterium sp.]HOS52129.1 transcription termination/antitermination protein NusG [Fervidobacterium sp.]
MKKEWFIIHTITGYENKVKENLEAKIQAQGYENLVSHVVVLEETVIDTSSKSLEKHIVSHEAKIHVTNAKDVEKGDLLAEEPAIKVRREGTITDVISSRRIVIETTDRKFSRTYVIPETAKPVSGLRVGTSVFQGTALASSEDYICDIDGKIIINDKVKKVIVRTPLGDEDVYVVHGDVFNSSSTRKGVTLKAGQILAEGRKIFAKSSGRISLVDFPTRKEIIVQKTRKRKLYPGYLFVEMVMNDHTYDFVRGTPFVMGFVSAGGRPIPLKPKEVHYVLRMAGIEETPQVQQQVTKVELEIQVGDSVKIITGPFEGFVGVVREIDEERQELKVNVTIFGRETPVSVHLSEVEKV